jgi:hypothetical protein
MKKLVALLLGVLFVCGCATTQQQVTTQLTDEVIAADQTPIQHASDALDILANNKLLRMVNTDADDTLAWVNSSYGPTDPLLKYQAQACPTAVKLATGSIQETIAELKTNLQEVDDNVQLFADDGNPRLILKLTKLRYGKPGQPGSDPAERVATLKKVLWAQISAVVDSCRMIVPTSQIDNLLHQAAAAGIK